MRKLKDKTRPQEQKDTYRRSEMEFGVAADAYRSDPTKKATRNGAVMISVVLALVAFAVVLAAFILALGRFTFAGIIVSVIVGLTVLSSVHVCMDWERVVVMRLGRFDRLAGPGLFFTIPLFEFCTLRVDQRMNATPFGAEEALTSDLVPLDVDAVLFWVIWDPEKACTEVQDCHFAVALSAQTAGSPSLPSLPENICFPRSSYQPCNTLQLHHHSLPHFSLHGRSRILRHRKGSVPLFPHQAFQFSHQHNISGPEMIFLHILSSSCHLSAHSDLHAPWNQHRRIFSVTSCFYPCHRLLSIRFRSVFAV